MAFNFQTSLNTILGTKKPVTPSSVLPAPTTNYSALFTANPTVSNLMTSLAPKPAIPSFATPTPTTSPVLAGPPKPLPVTGTPASSVKMPTYSPPPPQITNTPSLPTVNPNANYFGDQNAQNTPDSASGATNKPTMPSIPPEALKAVESSEKAYQESLKISPEELSTQEDLDKLSESAKKAYLDTKGQPIALEFITGQLKSIEERALALAEPLEKKMARLQASRTSSLEASKFALDRADKALETARDATKPIAGTSFYDPVTGTFKQAPSTSSTKAPEGFTLSPGEIRYDADGKQIASGGVKPISDAQQIKNDEKAEIKATAQTQILSNVSLVNEILKNPGAISGIFQSGSIPFTAGATTKNQYDQLKGLLSLDKRQLLKGSGAISDFEFKVLNQAATDLGRNQTEADFKKSLLKIRGAFQTAAGLEASVKVTPPGGEPFETTASRAEIDQVISQGGSVEYI